MSKVAFQLHRDNSDRSYGTYTSLDQYYTSSGKLDLTKLAKDLHKNQDIGPIKNLILKLPKAKVAVAKPKFSDIEQQLKILSKKPAELEAFVIKLAELMLTNGRSQRPRDITAGVHEHLLEIEGITKKMLANTAFKRAPQSLKFMKQLQQLSQRIIDFASSHEKLNSSNYAALNQTFQQIDNLVNQEKSALLSSIPNGLRKHIEQHGILTQDEAKEITKHHKQDHLTKLIKAGLIEIVKLDDGEKLLVYGAGQIDSTHYERLIPARMRDSLARAISTELKKVYPASPGLAASSLLDALRMADLAKHSALPLSKISIALKYYEQHGLIKMTESGYKITRAGHAVGLGVKGVRIAQNAMAAGESPDSGVSVINYLQAVKTMQKKWEMPTLTLKTKDGACPTIFLIDEFHAGEGRIDANILEQLLKDIGAADEGLVVASNMLQGVESVEPRAARTSLPTTETQGINYSQYENQIKLLRALYAQLKKPVLHIQGKNELQTAEAKADLQRPRDISAAKGIDKPSEQLVQRNLSSINEISERSNRKYSSGIHAQIAEFALKVEMPFELMLGRELMDSQTIEERTGLHNINEREIVRDIMTLLVKDQKDSGNHGMQQILNHYQEFLELPETGPNYIPILKQVIFNSESDLSISKLSAKDGAFVQLLTKDGKKSLRLAFLPEFRAGVSEGRAPTEKIISVLKSKTAAGEALPDIVVTGATGQAFLSLTAAGTLVVSPDSLQSSSVFHDYYRNEAVNRHKRRRTGRGGEVFGGALAFAGGVHKNPDTGELIKTDSYTLTLWNKKIQEVLADNAKRKLPNRHVDVYATSDFQTGSPTSRPDVWLKGMIDAVLDGCQEIVINGDVLQGQNYPREPIEAQLTGIIGIEDQQQFVSTLIQPVLDIIKELKTKNPEYKIPKFRIVVGNHETNSQSHKGGQGIWFLHSLAKQIEGFYTGAFSAEIGKSHVQYPRKFKNRTGTDVDYSLAVIDLTDEVGFRLAAQHYVGVGAKGSKTAPPVIGSAGWARSLENEVAPIHGWIWAHYHTQSFTQSDGMFHTIFGANADGSGFEWHLGYPTTVPASGRIRLFSQKAPELTFITEPYLNLQESKWKKKSSVYRALLKEYGSLDEFIKAKTEECRQRAEGATDFTKLKTGRHNFVDPNRKVA